MRRILWGRATSSNVMKAIWTLEELQLPYERIDVGGSFGKTDTAEYRAMNPTGLVPTLQEDDFTLWESNAICRYLCHAHAPHSKLWPQEPARPRQCRPLDGRAADAAEPADRRGVLGPGAHATRQARHGGDQAGDGGCRAHLGHGLGGARQASLPGRRRPDAGRHPVGSASASLVQHGRSIVPRCRICARGTIGCCSGRRTSSIWRGRWCRWRRRRSIRRRFAHSSMRAGNARPQSTVRRSPARPDRSSTALLDAARVSGGRACSTSPADPASSHRAVVQRGAVARGLDFSPAMLAVARARDDDGGV